MGRAPQRTEPVLHNRLAVLRTERGLSRQELAAAVPGKVQSERRLPVQKGQSRGVAGHQRVARSASVGRESTPQRAAARASRTSSRTAIKTSMTNSVPVLNLRSNMSFPNKISAWRIIGGASSSSI